jgi:nicotinamidase-related amidase
MTKALLVIDIQESFRQRPNWPYVSNPDVAAQATRLVEHARSSGDLVVWFLDAEPGSGTIWDPGYGYVRLFDELKPADGEPIMIKTSRNCFTTTNLQQWLTERGIRELVICGIQTEQCCETTARVAGDLGYDVTFVTDATATFPIPHWDAPDDRPMQAVVADPTTLSTDEVLRRTEYALAGRFATIKTVDELTGS